MCCKQLYNSLLRTFMRQHVSFQFNIQMTLKQNQVCTGLLISGDGSIYDDYLCAVKASALELMKRKQLEGIILAPE